MTKGLRFASLIRVSSEAQERQGESLLVQRKANEHSVARLGATIVETYGGQEHATPGWEKVEVNRLITDAGRGKFDPMIVAYDNRWSRDNAKSKEGLEAFRKAGIRFFVGTQERNLYSPTDCLFLGMSAEIGEFLASQQSMLSVLSRL